MWRRFIMWGVLAVAVLAGIVVALMPRPVPVDLAVVTRGDLMPPILEHLQREARARMDGWPSAADPRKTH